MDLSNDLISKFVKITNDDKNKNSESTVYGTVVEYNGGMYVRIDGSDLLTPVETTADFKPNERVTVMIKNHSATVTGNITSPATNEGAVTEKVTEAVEDVEGKVITEVEILIADRVSTEQLDAEVARIDELIAGKATVEDLTATNVEITNLKADKASIKDLTATNAEITNLKADKASVEDLTATNAEITNLKAKDAEIENLVADKATIENLTATNARIDSLQANKADITYLDANFATIDELEATNADIEVLDAEVADINTLVNGNLTSDNILSLNITSQNTTMENAFVKDAMIDTVTANKIMSGTIDTNNVTIQSTDGSMLLQGTLLQMKDDNGKVRIQIGKDTGGNFTFILYDESGTGVLIDEEGIKSSDAIADGLIVDAKVADNANIAGSKLDIASVITEVNNDNSTTIKSNKIYLDEQGQSLEVAFNSLKTQVETIQDVTIDGDLTAVVEQVQSNTTQIAANKEGISTLVSENTIRKEEIQNLDGEIESVNNTLSSKYSSLEQDVSGFKTTVADTYTTKSEFNNLQIGGTNTFKTSKVGSETWDINYSNSIITANSENGFNVVTADGRTHTRLYHTIKDNGYWTVSFKVKSSVYVGSIHIDICDKDAGDFNSDINWSEVTRTVLVDNYSVHPYNFVDIEQHIDCGQAITYYFKDVKVEKGNRPTAWSPAPEDVQGQIDATNANLQNNYSTTSQMNSAINQKANEITSSVSETYATKQSVTDVDNKFSNYSTTSAMNSAINQKANEITSSVSQTYATKQSVTDVNNNLTNNYSTTSQMNSAIQQKANEITSSVGQTYATKAETSLINDTVAGNRKWLFEKYTNNQNVGTGNSIFPTLAHLANETLISSRLIDVLPGTSSGIGNYYIGVYTVYLYYESAYTWSGSITSDDDSTTYLNGVVVCQAPSCTSTPFTMNFKKGINKLQIIHGEGNGGDGVTLSDLGPWKEYGAYPACVTAASSNHYASNSDIVQTANDLTIKFTESGGYNLLQNGHADKGTSYWNNNGGGITTHANAGGGATGNFFGTSLPHGIGYYDWVKLLPNTHYVYQAKVWSNVAFNGNSATPLHFWFSYDTVNNTGDGYTILDYQQNLSASKAWIQCYVHFVTGNADIYIKPFIYSGETVNTFYVTELMLSQSRVVQPWSPHPSEVYSGITQIDKDGIRVHHNNFNGYTHMAPDGFFVNNNGTDLVQVTASGLYVQGNITSGSTIQGARITGSTFNSSNDVFQVLEDGSIETSFLAVNGAVSTDKLNVNDIENASYPKVLTEATTVYISPNGGVNAEEFYDGAYFTSLSNMLAVAPRNLNGYTLTIRMAGDLYENAALTWFHSGQVNFEMQGYTLYGYFYGYGASMCYRLYGNTNANNNGTWGHIKPNVGRAMGSYYYAVQFQYCQFAVNYVAVYPSASSGSSSGGIGVHRGATGIVFNAKACGDMKYLVRAEYAGRVHVNATQGACNNSTFCATTGGIITLNSSNNQAGRSTTGKPYWVGSGGSILCDQLLGMDKITFNNTSQSGSSSSSGSTTRKVTETVKASSADTYRSTVYNNWKGDGTVRQGDYGYGDCQGCWFFGNNLYTTMNAGTVTKVVIRIQRQSGGVNALQTLTVKSHNHTSRPSGAPTYTDTIGTCSCAVGSSIDLVITDSTTINKLKKCKGLGLSIGSASSPYAVCSGACSVIITYTTNS